MHLLYPSDPFDKKRPDEQYAEEYEAVMTAGLRTVLFSFEDFEAGLFKTSAPLTPGKSILYRGWMLTPDAYAALVNQLREKGVTEVTNATQYQHCHHLPQWYPLLAACTSETVVLDSDANFAQALEGLQWPGYFIKDYVKSLNTGGGSLVDSPEDIAPLVEEMRQYRGQIEGGICVRRREEYLEETERRYFVLHGRAYGVTDEIPELVTECARLIDSPFFFGRRSTPVRRCSAGGRARRWAGIRPQGMARRALCLDVEPCGIGPYRDHREPGGPGEQRIVHEHACRAWRQAASGTGGEV